LYNDSGAKIATFVKIFYESFMKKLKVILSGGGTGGHIYPAVAVAEELRRQLGEGVEVLFVGAEGRMEMEKIPALGYEIRGLPVAGIQRRLSLSNLALPLKIARSVARARAILREFRPDVVAGFGGYASAPIVWAAQRMGIPTIIQEQNSYAGVANKILGRRARHVCVAYDGMERFFPAARIVHTGNPLRGTFGVAADRAEALRYFGLTDGRPVLLVLGGSLGTRTLNEMMKRWVDAPAGDVQVIWQTGKYYQAGIDAFMESRSVGGELTNQNHTRVWRDAFINRMDLAFAAADVVISRSGATTVSELALAAKPVVFVPSPNVSEDHQTKNARALVDRGAALMVADADAVVRGMDVAVGLLADPARRALLAANIRATATPDAARKVAELVVESCKK
jgi:UDP-N-acetylglucosamine--N-acetylmuramyl-(pentapeptide) pyrophosphoryl-undecaprenol N-acetylglucosamine transferase